MMLTKVYRSQAKDNLIAKVHARRQESLNEETSKTGHRTEMVTEIPEGVMTDSECLDLMDFLRA